jgi:hypothetical protein
LPIVYNTLYQVCRLNPLENRSQKEKMNGEGIQSFEFLIISSKSLRWKY